MRALIGIPPALDDRGGGGTGRPAHVLETAYARAVVAAGGSVVLVPPQEDAGALVKRLDGVLIPGGGDFAPDRPYPAGVAFAALPASRLAWDRQLLAAALGRGIPLLGICYGMQLLAIHHGGTLLYDIPTDRPAAGRHALEAGGRHGLSLLPKTRLSDLLGPEPGPVNSRHHQAVAEPGPGLLVCARAEDGIVEAVERPGDPFCLGVQWHPEDMEGPHRERLFAAFVAASRSV
jgi:putative glutamine amidotransferase